MPRKAFDLKLQELHNDILRMGSMVEKQIHQSIDALVKKDSQLAAIIIANDDLVDKLNREIEDKCILLIAQETPIATDLRTIFTAIKIVTDLERMGDHAVDIARICIRLKNENYIKELIDIPLMGELVNNMIKAALDAYVLTDEKAAVVACNIDDEIDSLYKKTFNELIGLMVKDNSTINQSTQFLFICKYLERIADHVTNICEWTIYLIKGEYKNMND
jgi:phosphate transport system protein